MYSDCSLEHYKYKNTMFHTAPSWMNNIIQLSPKENVNFKPAEKEKNKTLPEKVILSNASILFM